MRLIDADAAIDALNHMRSEDFDGLIVNRQKVESMLKALPSVQPDIIRCKDCIYQTESWSGIKYCEAHGDHIGKDYDYCSNARRKENG